jgi:competence protein ComEC
VRSSLASLSSIAFLLLVAAHCAVAKTLDIYFIDVEGGQSTLLVTPKGESTMEVRMFPIRLRSPRSNRGSPS